MRIREFVRVRLKSRKSWLRWHTVTDDSKYLLCNASVAIENVVIEVAMRQEHKAPSPLCPVCAYKITPRYTKEWTEVIRLYPH